MTTVAPERLTRIREIIAENIDVDLDGLSDTALFIDELGADSLKLIDVLSALEMEYSIVIDMNELPKMINVEATYQVTSVAAGW
ncbi:acyl carrier protein [Streptomyces sp. uw30]|uniref:acyl carrier protein n=1 Tax=unclassified Streptomyces TaxID=2593676 RepID=UPI0011CE8277|nr:acyl carrier protein [Streptomyces sp. uw30]TXS49949.1 acyl carrier protein [Streptomyces sp. uw30]WSU50702.1 acyl carrier protein [Streptomyces sp. NBC_01092]